MVNKFVAGIEHTADIPEQLSEGGESRKRVLLVLSLVHVYLTCNREVLGRHLGVSRPCFESGVGDQKRSICIMSSQHGGVRWVWTRGLTYPPSRLIPENL